MCLTSLSTCSNVSVQSNSSCNFFEWVDEGDFKMEGSLQRKSEEVEVCIENVVLDLRKKKDKLKKKLEEERKNFKMILQILAVLTTNFTMQTVLFDYQLYNADYALVFADPPACDVDAAPTPASLADLLPICGADADAPFPAIDAALPACDADADAPLPSIDAALPACDADAPLPASDADADAVLLDADPGVDVEAPLLSYERSKIVR
ncbi:hypothetical protein LR48_Vigan08g116600 [Vigna angularis]|uniref:Uncharacterized protein n=1 Tax=Phaseolus angularis TaxID=3914 RepID=A0A0L9V6N6_PHAAN|nr:hypothetical protein LR48_Vigan08g116600 [Vigna angularis]